mgnify:FL=1
MPTCTLRSMSITRRDFGRSVLAGLAATSVAGCGSSGGDSGSGGSGGNGGSGGLGGSGGVNGCTLYAQQASGPFYLDLDSIRQDITEGKAGQATRVALLVQDEACTPLRDLAVDLWHCDAVGVYSGFPNQLGGLDTTGETFLRGTQITDADGIVEFETIYPGWYPGRTTHMHFKVHTSSTMEATSQLYFPEDTSAAVYGTEPYAARGQKDTSNDADGLLDASPVPLVTMSGDAAAGYTAMLVVTVL